MSKTFTVKGLHILLATNTYILDKLENNTSGNNENSGCQRAEA